MTRKQLGLRAPPRPPAASTLGVTRNSAPAAIASRARSAVVTVPMPIHGGPGGRARSASSSRTRPAAPGTVKVISTSSTPAVGERARLARAASADEAVRTTPMIGVRRRLWATWGRVSTVVVMRGGSLSYPSGRSPLRAGATKLGQDGAHVG